MIEDWSMSRGVVVLVEAAAAGSIARAVVAMKGAGLPVGETCELKLLRSGP